MCVIRIRKIKMVRVINYIYKETMSLINNLCMFKTCSATCILQQSTDQ